TVKAIEADGRHEGCDQRTKREVWRAAPRRVNRSGKLEPKPRLDPGVPLVTLIFPIAALAAGDVGEALDQLDPHQIFGVLVAQLTLDPQPDRRAVRHRQ